MSRNTSQPTIPVLKFLCIVGVLLAFTHTVLAFSNPRARLTHEKSLAGVQSVNQAGMHTVSN